MKFFTRCKILLKILIVICVIFGVVLVVSFLNLLSVLSLIGTGYSLLPYLLCLALFLILVIIVITLSIVIKDAEEDMNAILQYLRTKTND